MSDAVADGVGLRLAAVYGIVKQNNGYITLEEGEDGGNVFWVCLPRSSAAIQEELANEGDNTQI